MCNKDIEGRNQCVWGLNFIAFNVLLHTKLEQKLKVNWLCALLIFKKSVNWGFNKKYTYSICVGRVWIVTGYFLLKKYF